MIIRDVKGYGISRARKGRNNREGREGKKREIRQTEEGRPRHSAPPHKILDPPLADGVSNTNTTRSCCSIGVCAKCLCVFVVCVNRMGSCR